MPISSAARHDSFAVWRRYPSPGGKGRSRLRGNDVSERRATTKQKRIMPALKCKKRQPLRGYRIPQIRDLRFTNIQARPALCPFDSTSHGQRRSVFRRPNGFFLLRPLRPSENPVASRISGTGSWCCLCRPLSKRLRRQSILCGCRRCRSPPCSDVSRWRCPGGFPDAARL